MGTAGLLLSEEPATIEMGRLLGELGVAVTGFLGFRFSPKRSSSESVSVVDSAGGEEAEPERLWGEASVIFRPVKGL